MLVIVRLIHSSHPPNPASARPEAIWPRPPISNAAPTFISTPGDRRHLHPSRLVPDQANLATSRKPTSSRDWTLPICSRASVGQDRVGHIAEHDNIQAGDDLSGVAQSCETVDGGSTDGLVYPFDFPDPYVLTVGTTTFAYATNSVEGNIQIIESVISPIRPPSGTPTPAGELGGTQRDLGAGGASDRGALRPLLHGVGGQGSSPMHFGRLGVESSRTVRRFVNRPIRVSTDLGWLD